MTDKNLNAVRLRRSVLYLPGGNARALDKARELPADALIFDLEDAVAPERKAEARSLVSGSLRAGGYGARECVVRINGPDTPWFDDDAATLADTPAAAVLLPKVAAPADVRAAESRLCAAGVAESMPLWIMAETASCVLDIAAICRSSARIACVVVGTSDLARELRVPHTPGRLGLVAALSLCVLAARAARVDVIDGVHLDLDDERGFEKSCEQGRNLGFDGKSLIHPRQVAPANRAFSPAVEDIAHARRVVEAWRTAHESGQGVTVVDGRLVESLHAAEAERVLELARLVAERGGEAADAGRAGS